MHKASTLQQKAIRHFKGPARVIAGPGSGKTYTIIQRLLYLIRDCGIPASQILTISYTKAAAAELQTRFLSETQTDSSINSRSAVFGTFHSFCYFLLKTYCPSRQRELITPLQKKQAISTILSRHHISTEYEMLEQTLQKISYCKNNNLLIPLCDSSPEISGRIYTDYQKLLREINVFDFDDLILETRMLLIRNPEIAKKVNRQYPFLQVDEFQDINRLQYDILKSIAKPGNHLFVVGDDDQSIYGFRGSAPGILQSFASDFAGCRTYYLSENFRSAGNIVMLADDLIRKNTIRIAKTPIPVREEGLVRLQKFTTRREEELALLHILQQLPESDRKDTAIIVRTNLEARRYRHLLEENSLLDTEKSAPLNWSDSFVLKDILHFLRFIREGRHRRDFLEIMNKPIRYIQRDALPDPIVRCEDLLRYYGNNLPMQQEIRKLFLHLDHCAGLSPYLAIQMFRRVLHYDDYLTGKNLSLRQYYLETADRIQKIFLRYVPPQDLEAFLRQEIDSARSHGYQPDTEKEALQVITMHGSKGLEFKTVFLPDLNEGILPSKNCTTTEELEEERRLLYVAMTRAEKNLYLFYTGERNRKISRYLEHLRIPHQ